MPNVFPKKTYTKHLELFPAHTTSSPFQKVWGFYFLTSFKPYISIFMLSFKFNQIRKGTG